MPVAGSKRHWTAKSTISTMPSQYCGMDMPAIPIPLTARSAGRPSRAAAKAPSRTPPTQLNSVAPAASFTVLSKAGPTSDKTGRRLCSDSPKSPVATCSSHNRNCTGIGLSNP